jgi:hypothetical protein
LSHSIGLQVFESTNQKTLSRESPFSQLLGLSLEVERETPDGILFTLPAKEAMNW